LIFSAIGAPELKIPKSEAGAIVEAMADFSAAWFPGGTGIVLPPKIMTAIVLFGVLAQSTRPRLDALKAKSRAVRATKQKPPMTGNVVHPPQFHKESTTHDDGISDLDDGSSMDDFPEFDGEIPAL
jgi:hypothetical protein